MLKGLLSLGTFLIWTLSVCSGAALMYYSLVHWWPELPMIYQFLAVLFGMIAGFKEAVATYSRM